MGLGVGGSSFLPRFFRPTEQPHVTPQALSAIIITPVLQITLHGGVCISMEMVGRQMLRHLDMLIQMVSFRAISCLKRFPTFLSAIISAGNKLECNEDLRLS